MIFRVLKEFLRNCYPAHLLYHCKNVKSIFAIPTRATSRNLNLGCGMSCISGYCNIDILPLDTVDIVDDSMKLYKFKNNFAERIYASHILEHCDHHRVWLVLNRWYEVLKPGGEIRISVPDIEKIMELYVKNKGIIESRDGDAWLEFIFGGQKNRYDYHKTGFTESRLTRLLDSTGFVNIDKYPCDPPFIKGLKDSSLKKPFGLGVLISLNMKAYKPPKGMS